MKQDRSDNIITDERPTLATSAVSAQSARSHFGNLVTRQTKCFKTVQRTNTRAISRITDTTVPSSLTLKFAGDVGVAAGITFAVSPFLVFIDKAVVQKAAGTHTISRSVMESFTTMVRNPVSYVKSPTFLMMWGVYLATYSTANCCKTFIEHQEKFQETQGKLPAASNDNRAKAGVFVATTAVNSAASMLKDKYYATKFSASGAPAKVPLITYGLWGVRDCMVIGSSFVLPDIVSGVIEREMDVQKTTALQISQFFCPIVTQVLVTPVQVLGLDFYNRPLASAMERVQLQYANFSSIVAARISRIAPAYSIGGIGNTYFRTEWRNYLLRRELRTRPQTMYPSYFAV